jgi:hypothetical protein
VNGLHVNKDALLGGKIGRELGWLEGESNGRGFQNGSDIGLMIHIFSISVLRYGAFYAACAGEIYTGIFLERGRAGKEAVGIRKGAETKGRFGEGLGKYL